MKPSHIRFSEADRCAIDMNHDLYLTTTSDSACTKLGSCVARSGLAWRVQQIGRVFELLGKMPAEDAPANLVDRTLSFVKKRGPMHQVARLENRSRAVYSLPPHTIHWPSHRAI